MLKPLGHRWRERCDRVLQAVQGQLMQSAAATQLRSVSGSEDVWQNLSAYLDLIISWNKHLDLTAARNNDELVDLVLADAVVLACFAELDQSWVDVGSGAGAPGAALAVLRADLALTLVEPQQKRVAFLRALAGTLTDRQLKVERARAQELSKAAWDAAVSRATFEPNEWLGQGSALAKREIWLLLARGTPPVLEGWAVATDVTYDWPLGGVSRRAVKYVPKMP